MKNKDNFDKLNDDLILNLVNTLHREFYPFFNEKWEVLKNDSKEFSIYTDLNTVASGDILAWNKNYISILLYFEDLYIETNDIFYSTIRVVINRQTGQIYRKVYGWILLLEQLVQADKSLNYIKYPEVGYDRLCEPAEFISLNNAQENIARVCERCLKNISDEVGKLKSIYQFIELMSICSLDSEAIHDALYFFRNKKPKALELLNIDSDELHGMI